MINFAVAVALLAAQTGPADYFALRKKALDDFAAKHYAEAAEEFGRLTKAYDQDGLVWRGYANALYQTKQFKEAAPAFIHAHKLGDTNFGTVAYNAACSFALSGQKEQAFSWLEVALKDRFGDRPKFATDTDLDSLHSDTRWPAVAGLLPSHPFTRDEGWRYDLAYLVSEVKRMHYDYSRQPLPPAVQARIESLRSAIPKLNDAQVAFEMQKIVAGLGDGHTVLYPVNKQLTPLRLPLQLYRFPEGLYITECAQNPGLVGARVEKIGSKNVADVLAQLPDLVSHDNPMTLDWIGPYYLTFTQMLVGMGVTPDAKSVPLTVVDPEGHRTEVAVKATLPLPPFNPKLVPIKGTSPLYLTNLKENYWFQALTEPHALYCQFNSVGNKGPETLPQFALRLRGALEEQGIKNLIMDVRLNNGGDGGLLKELVRTLVVFDSKPGNRLFVLISRNTFSAAQTFVNRLELDTNAIFVGEPTGSRPAFNGEDTNVVLPWSRTQGSISTRFHSANGGDSRLWIAPQIPVTLTAADYFAGRDPVLDTVRKMIASG